MKYYTLIFFRFDVAKSTVHIAVMTIAKKLTEVSGEFITWPTGSHLLQVVASFKERANFPGIWYVIIIIHDFLKLINSLFHTF